MSETETKDLMPECAGSLARIADALEQISEILESCKSGEMASGRHAILTIPITD